MKKIVLVLSVVNLGLSGLAMAQQVRVKKECQDDHYNDVVLQFAARKNEVAMKKKLLGESLKRSAKALEQVKKVLSTGDGKSLITDWKLGKIAPTLAIKGINRLLTPVATGFNNDPELPLFPGVADDSAKTWHNGQPYRFMVVTDMGDLELTEKTHIATPGFDTNACVAEADATFSHMDCVHNRVHVWSEDEDTAKEYCFKESGRIHQINNGMCSKREFLIATKVAAKFSLVDGKAIAWPTDKSLRADAVMYKNDGRGVIDPGSILVEADYLNYNAFLRANLDAGCFAKK